MIKAFWLAFVPFLAFAAHDTTLNKTEVRLEKTDNPILVLNAGIATEAAKADPDGWVRVMLFIDLQKKNDFHLNEKSDLTYQKKIIGTSLKAFDLGSIWDEKKQVGMVTGYIKTSDLDPHSIIEETLSQTLNLLNKHTDKSLAKIMKTFSFKPANFQGRTRFMFKEMSETLGQDVSPGARIILVFDNSNLVAVASSRGVNNIGAETLPLKNGYSLYLLNAKVKGKKDLQDALNWKLTSAD